MAPNRDIATGIGATVLIFAAVFRLTIIGFFCSIILPLPVLFYRVKLGRKPAVIIAGVSAAIMAAMIGTMAVDLLFCLWLLMIGFVLGELYEKGLSPSTRRCSGRPLSPLGPSSADCCSSASWPAKNR
jgi:uncharacterized protein YybS (DUF2232 family)